MKLQKNRAYNDDVFADKVMQLPQPERGAALKEVEGLIGRQLLRIKSQFAEKASKRKT
jgi:hypothetical protein